MKAKIMAILAAIGAFFSAVFYVLFVQAKAERMEEDKKRAEDKAKASEVYGDKLEAAQAAAEVVRIENEDKVQLAHSGNHLSNFSACVELLQK